MVFAYSFYLDTMGQNDGTDKTDKSSEFNFEGDDKRPILGEDLGSGKGNEESTGSGTMPPPNAGFAGMGESLNLAHLIGKETLNWVRGDLEGKPTEIKQLGEDFAQKLNWYVGCTILAQYARVPALFDVLNTVGDKLFAANIVDAVTDPNDLVNMYTSMTKEIMGIMEFARKFVVQNKDYLADNSNFFDRSLFEKIKSLPTDMVKDYLTLFQIVETKGQDVLKQMIEEYK
jgi:hypothetical protein